MFARHKLYVNIKHDSILEEITKRQGYSRLWLLHTSWALPRAQSPSTVHWSIQQLQHHGA